MGLVSEIIFDLQAMRKDAVFIKRWIGEGWKDCLKWSMKPFAQKVVDAVMWSLLGLNFGIFVGCAWKHMLSSVIVNGIATIFLIYTIHERGRMIGSREGWNIFHDAWVIEMDRLDMDLRKKLAEGYTITGINVKGPTERVQ